MKMLPLELSSSCKYHNHHSSPHFLHDKLFVVDKARLDEQYVQDVFHSFLRSFPSQAKAERLLDVKLRRQGP